METNWIGNTIQLIVIGAIAYVVVDFVKPLVSKGASVEKTAGKCYDNFYNKYRANGLDFHQASQRAYNDTVVAFKPLTHNDFGGNVNDGGLYNA